MPLQQHTLPVVGIDYPNKRGPGRRFELALCAPGDSVELRPEPTNPADPCAVAVFSERGVQLGYLPAERCARIFALIGKGRKVSAVFQGQDAWQGYVRIAYDGDRPQIPPARPQPKPDPDFWPDPLWDDDGSQI